MEQIQPLLQVGAQFTLSGSPFEIAAVKNDEVRIAPMKGGAMAHLKFKALSDLMNRHQITVTYLPQDIVEQREQSLRGLKAKMLACTIRRGHYSRRMVAKAPANPCSQSAIKKYLPELAAEINDPNPPGASTIADWVRKWLRGGRKDYALITKIRPSRTDYSHLDPKVLEIVNTSIENVYLTTQRNNKKAVYADVVLRIANFNVDNGAELVVPSEYVVGKLIGRIDLYERDLRRHKKAYATRRHRAAGMSFLATEPLQMCMADGQNMDVMLVEIPQDGGPRRPLGRPFLTVILDLRTRCVLAAFISLQPFCGGTVLKAMMEAVVAVPGKPRGIMSTLIVDNGCDYQDSGFIRFLGEIGVTLEICGPRSPNGKANVERFFRTLNDDLIHKLPGTTFSNPTSRGDYQSQDLAQMTIDELRGRVQTWIDEVYHQRTHRALGRAPIDVWNEETAS